MKCALRMVRRCGIAAPADRDGPVTLDGVRLVVRLPGRRLVWLLEPAGDDCVAAGERHFVAVPRAVAVHGVIGEERLDRPALLGAPRLDVSVKPGLDVVSGHCSILRGEGARGPSGRQTGTTRALCDAMRPVIAFAGRVRAQAGARPRAQLA